METSKQTIENMGQVQRS